MGINLLVLGALIVLLAAAHLYVRANPTMLARHIRTAAGIMAASAALLLLTRGAAGFAALAGLAAAWLLWGQARLTRSAPKAKQVTSIKTDHLDVQLDHDSGLITGHVLKGMFAGRTLQNLKPAELALLWQDCRFVDMKSAQILEAYLDKVHPTWQADIARGEEAMARGPDGKMGEKEALEILGLKKGAGEEEIRKAHRELMMRLHPDRGGSTYLASKVNEAKAVLLKE